MLGTSDPWLMSPLSGLPIEPAYYIDDWRIQKVVMDLPSSVLHTHKSMHPLWSGRFSTAGHFGYTGLLAMKAGKSAIWPWLICPYNENMLVDPP